MLDDFMLRAGLAGVGLALAAGPLGCFVIWRRMAYFGDATSHAAILGVALALALDAPVFGGVLLTAMAMGLLISGASGGRYASDTMLGVAAHGALAAGLVAIAFLPGLRIDLMGYLFGDILAVTWADLGVIWGGAALVLAFLAWRWRALITETLSPDLAAAAGAHPDWDRRALTLALAVLVAVALKVVGALLITAMLIIPAAAARALARSPEAMALAACGIGAAAAVGGLQASFLWDSPTGPTIVVAAAAIFLGLNAARGLMPR